MPGNDIHGGFATHITVPARGPCVADEQRLAAVGIELADLSVIADAVTTAARVVARHAGLLASAGVDLDAFAPASWQELFFPEAHGLKGN